MNKRRIQVAVVLGIFAIAAIISFQYIWLKEAFDQEKRKFNQSAQIALLEVVKLVVNDNQSPFPHSNPVQKISEDYYLVRINDEIDAKILEFYLKNEFEKLSIKSDFEYAIYNCSDDEMVYGNYISLQNNHLPKKTTAFFPKMDGLVYYFGVRFHNQSSFLSGETGTWTIIALISMVILIIYIYSVFVILRQNRYYELQKNFINNMTHEFKTPLASIMLASQSMLDNSTIKKDVRLSKYADALQSQSQRLNEHVEQILTLSKSEKNNFQPAFSEFNLQEAIQYSVSQFINPSSDKIDININFPNDPIIIRGDEAQFVNLVNNLIGNAIKYGSQPINIAIIFQQESSFVNLKIQDNGSGIPKKHQKRVFDKFYRVPLNDHQVVKGFGLGLYYVKNICELHGWKIKLESSPEQGTSFTIKIPIEHD